MIESSNPDVNVDALVQRVRERVRELGSRTGATIPFNALNLRSGVFLNAVEALVNIADQRAQVRTQWPSRLAANVFRSAKLRTVGLRILAFLFKDQRHVNEALIAAFRESIDLDRHLIEQIHLLRDELEELKRGVRASAEP